MIFIEVINATQIRLYHNGQAQTLDDAAGLARIPNDKTPIMLFDSQRIQSKQFTRQVKDTTLLDKVIVAEMAEDLLDDVEQYQFTHVVLDGQRWVSWIRHSDLAQLKARFAEVAPRVVGLSTMPLLLKSASTSADIHCYMDTALFYGVMNEETITLPSAQACDWLNMMGLAEQTVIPMEQAKANFTAERAKKLPNLWHHQAVKTSKSPYAVWALLLVGIFGLWGVNAYGDYRQAKQRVNDVQTAQQQVLKQVFPNANTADAYGRLSAEFQRIQGRHSVAVLNQLLLALQEHPVHLTEFIIDVGKRRVQLKKNISSEQQKRLKKSGFTIKKDNEQTVIEW